MDSGNSGSLQSSSGGDDDFDAACGGGGADSSTSSPLAALLRQQGFGGGGEGGASSLIYGLQELGAPPLSHWCSTTTAPLPVPPPAGAAASASQTPASLPCHGGGGLLAASSAPAADHAAASATPEAKPAAAPPRGSRKRARASRRAPTTVLTTDTSNFRAMVQEFTGIPAPPFAGGGGARSRLDHLFPSRSSSSAAFPQYLLRPFAHNKQQLHAYQPPPFTSPSTSQPAPATAVAPGDGYPQQLITTTDAAPSNHLLGMQDHGGSSTYLSFQSTLGAELHGGDANDNKYPVFDHRGAAPPPSATRLMQDPADFLGLAAHVGVMNPTEGSSTLAAAHLHQRNGDELSGLVVGGCKATYSSSARPLLARNGPRRPPPAGASTEETTTTTATAAMRMQGVDSWVCTSE